MISHFNWYGGVLGILPGPNEDNSARVDLRDQFQKERYLKEDRTKKLALMIASVKEEARYVKNWVK